MGILLLGSAPQFSQRNVINVNFTSVAGYEFLNHVLIGGGSIGPVGSAFNGTVNTANPWPTYIDAQGWPNTAIPASNSFGGSVHIPDPADFGGTYVLSWDGSGEVLFGGTGLTWTETNSNTTWVRVSNGRWQTRSGQTSTRIEFTLSASGAGPQLVAFQWLSTNLNAGGYVKNMNFFRKSEESELLAGNVFRMAYKQQIAGLNPSAFRFMNWHGGNSPWNCRFENRTLPFAAGYAGSSNFVASPVYATNATFTDAPGTANQYALAAATPTSSNTQNTSSSMVHGEIATCRVGTAMVRTTTKTVTGISKAVAGSNVVSCTGHGFSTGDIIIHVMGQTGSNFVGMTQLNYRPVTVTSIDANSYSIDVDTTSFTTFANGTDSGKSTVTAYPFPTLQVGNGNDRTAYPIAQQYGFKPVASLAANTYYTFTFDKNLSIQKDSSGNWVYGAWVVNTGQGGGHFGEVPLEIMATLVNELNAISASPIDMWLNIPHMALTTQDPDYSTQSDWAKNAVTTVISGANGYPGLTTRAKLFVEYSNETWNFGAAFTQTYYLWWRGYLRYGSAIGTTDGITMASLRSTMVARDIRAAFPNNSRVKTILGLWGSQGIAVASHNYKRVFGSSAYLSDTLVVSGSYGTPLSNHDCTCHASYMDAGDGYYGGTGAGSFTDDSAMYAGTTPYASPNQAQAIANFVAAVTTDTSSNASSMNSFTNPSNPTAGLDYAYASTIGAAGKTSIQYEGGPDFRVGTAYIGVTHWGSHVLTAADLNLTQAAINSAGLGANMVAYMNARSGIAKTGMPAVYLYIGNSAADRRWAYCAPDSYTGGVEGQALLNNGPWAAMSARNATTF